MNRLLPLPACLVVLLFLAAVLPSIAQTLIWGIPEKTCIAYGGRYDPASGLSEWRGKLTLTKREPGSIAGTFITGRKTYAFSSQVVKSVVQHFSLQTGDKKLLIAAARIDADRLRFTVGYAGNQAAYTYDLARKADPELVRGSAFTIQQLTDSEEILLLPLLSYHLGAVGLTGSAFPAALPIHRLALSVAGQRQVELLTIKGDRLAPLSIALPGSGTGVDCTGRMPGTRAQECDGQCGPFWFGRCICWDWACGDCCCHQTCLDHDRACRCGDEEACYVNAFSVLACGTPCNNPGPAPRCSNCPSGQFYCTHTGRCQANGSLCRPTCGPGQTYCERLGRCLSKAQCQPQSCTNASCGSGQLCYQGQCLYY